MAQGCHDHGLPASHNIDMTPRSCKLQVKHKKNHRLSISCFYRSAPNSQASPSIHTLGHARGTSGKGLRSLTPPYRYLA